MGTYNCPHSYFVTEGFVERSQKVPQPAAAFLISPWLDVEHHSAIRKNNASTDAILSEQLLNTMSIHYLKETSRKHPLVHPRGNCVQGLPPLLIHVGSEEILLDDSLTLEKMAQEAKVEVNLKIWSKLWHIFHIAPSSLKEAREALQDAGDFMEVEIRVIA